MGAGVRVVGAQHCPLGLHALWGLLAAGVVGGHPRGGWSATVVWGVWCQALSLPPPSVLWGGRPGFRYPGCGPCGRGDPAPAPQRAPLRAGVARCGDGRRASPGGGAFHRCEGRLGSGAPPLSTPSPLGGLLGSATHVLWARVCGRGGPAPAPWLACPAGRCAPRGARGASGFRRPLFPAARPLGGLPGPAGHVLWARVWVCAVCVVSVRVVVRGAAFLLSLWCSPLRCCGAVLCPPCTVCLPCSLPCARPLLGCWLPLVSFVASSLFTALYPFLYSPFSLVCTFSLPWPWCVSLSLSSPARLSLSLGPVRQREDGGMWALNGWVRPPCDVGTTFVAAACSVARHITYLSSHLCLHVCARSSPFAPYHGVLMSHFPYPYLFVCCLSWRRCTPCTWTAAWYVPTPLSFVLFVRCSSPVRGVAHHGNILLA